MMRLRMLVEPHPSQFPSLRESTWEVNLGAGFSAGEVGRGCVAGRRGPPGVGRGRVSAWENALRSLGGMA